MNQPQANPESAGWRRRIRQACERLACGDPWFLLRSAGEQDGGWQPSEDFAPKVLLPGSFNPLHWGHLSMAAIAARQTGHDVYFEFSFRNADKPEAGIEECSRRLIPGLISSSPAEPGFHPHGLLVSRSATFAEKSQVFPEVVFAVGVDTMVRIADPTFYEDSIQHRDRALSRLRDQGCRFLVFGRRGPAGFETVSDIALPDRLREICDSVPESVFRMDVSSSGLRRE